MILSNHGGRQLDSAIAPLDALPAARVACPSHGTLLLDSGIRRGSDAVKAVALGASAVLLGRAVLYGLAVDGMTGALRVIDIIKDEIDCTMAMLGCARVADLDASYVGIAGPLS
ncbi:alpha-hydroxy acid oxidase [Paraburkholderia sp. D1E]|uniref:alpha-hydroxy acid oxidase n=1 Tax=Paraburkholderia sp. D1E TaxID=3461398 RepID=UPI004045658B